MKSVIAPQLRRSVGPMLALALALMAGPAQAQTEPAAEPASEPAAEPASESEAAPAVQPQVQAQSQVPPPQSTAAQPHTSWRPLEVGKPRRSAKLNFTWESLPLGISLDTRTTWPQDDGTRRILGRKWSRSAGVSVSYDVLRLSDKLTASVDLGWSFASRSNNNVSSGDEEELRTHLLALGLSLRYHVLRWLAPYARVAGGMGWDKLTVGGDAGRWQDSMSFAHGSLGGGLFLRSPGVPLGLASLGVALMGSIEGGYFLAPASSLALAASSDPEIEHPIPSAAVPLGSMGRSAPYLRATIGLAF